MFSREHPSLTYTAMNKSFIKLLVVASAIIVLLIGWRLFYYFPNDEVDSGLEANAGGALATSSPTSSRGLPSKLIIPKLEIETDVQRLGVTKSGNMAAPDNFKDVSWYKFGTVPGDTGSAVIAGHEDNAISTPAIFYHLNDLEIGDEVYVVDESGKRLRFKVVRKEIHPYNLSGQKLEEIFNSKDKARLNLITCAGDWLPSVKTNDKRLVVYTEFVK